MFLAVQQSSECVLRAQKIKGHDNVHKLYQQQLLKEGVLKDEDVKRMSDHIGGACFCSHTALPCSGRPLSNTDTHDNMNTTCCDAPPSWRLSPQPL